LGDTGGRWVWGNLDLLRETLLVAGAVSRWWFDGSVEADDEDAAVAAEQLGICCSDADGVITVAVDDDVDPLRWS